jgi:hypothetical protein
MNSEILNNMGLGDVDVFYLYITVFSLVIILLLVIVVLLIYVVNMKKRLSHFMSGRNAASLEEEIGGVFRDISMLKEHDLKFRSDIREIKANLLECYQKVGVVKYDAFREMGGQLSFSIALLDKQDNGFILNSVHSANGCYTYTKEIQNGVSYIDLAEEEREALSRAMRVSESAGKAQGSYRKETAIPDIPQSAPMQQGFSAPEDMPEGFRAGDIYQGMGYDIPERSYSSRQAAMSGTRAGYGEDQMYYGNVDQTGDARDDE